MRLPSFLAAASLVAVAACTSGAPRRPPGSLDLVAPGPPAALRVFATGDTRGFLEPCGCEEGQFGGVARRLTYLRGVRRDGDLRIDLGNLSVGIGEVRRLRREGALEALSLAEYDVLVPGRAELADGPAFREAARARGVRVVCANVVDDRGEPMFERVHVHTVPGGARVGVVGISEAATTPVPGWWTLEPADAMRRTLAEIRGKFDVVLAATSLPEPDARALAAEFPDLALVLAGTTSESGEETARAGDVPVAFVGHRAEYVARVEFDEKFRLTTARRAWLDERLVDALDGIAIVRRCRDAVAALDAAYVGSVIDDRRKDGFAGSHACAPCHRDEHRVWRESHHAVAMRTLERRGANRDPECVPCHLVDVPPAPGAPSAPPGAGPESDPDALGVGCEACHGGSAAHAVRPEVRTPVPDGGRGTCVSRCHHPPEVRNFDLEAQWRRIGHGGK